MKIANIEDYFHFEVKERPSQITNLRQPFLL